jgi:type IV pilus assembly protein PilZ
MTEQGKTPSSIPPADERRIHDRVDVDEWKVDCVALDTFLYASIANISEMGVFVRTEEPLAIGKLVRLAFAPPGHEPFKLQGEVAWINKVKLLGDNLNPGMGVRFVDLAPPERERLVEVIRTIVYLRDQN